MVRDAQHGSVDKKDAHKEGDAQHVEKAEQGTAALRAEAWSGKEIPQEAKSSSSSNANTGVLIIDNAAGERHSPKGEELNKLPAEQRQGLVNKMMEEFPTGGSQKRILSWLGQLSSASEKGDIQFDPQAVLKHLGDAGYKSSLTTLDPGNNHGQMGSWIISSAMKNLEARGQLPQGLGSVIDEHLNPSQTADTKERTGLADSDPERKSEEKATPTSASTEPSISIIEKVSGPKGGIFDLTKSADGNYKMEVRGGTVFDSAALAAIEQATQRKAEVSFRFNGAELKANSKSSLDQLSAQYDGELRRKAEEYRKSPEGIQAEKEEAERMQVEKAKKSTLEAQYGKFSDRPDIDKVQFTPANQEGLKGLINKADTGRLTGYGKDLDYRIINHVNVVNAELQKIADKDGANALTADVVNKVFADTDVIGHSGASASAAESYIMATAREDVGRAVYKALEPNAKTSYEDFVAGFDKHFGGSRTFETPSNVSESLRPETVHGPYGRYEITRQPDGSYKMDTGNNYHLEDASVEAIKQAGARNAEVSFDFNGINVKANAKSTVAEMVKSYDDETDRQWKAYQESPAGKKAAQEQAERQAKEDAQRTKLESEYGKFMDRPEIDNLKFTPRNPEALASLVKAADTGDLTGYGKELDYGIINHAKVLASELQKVADKDGASALTPEIVRRVFNETDVVGHSGFSAGITKRFAIASAREDVGRAMLKAFDRQGKASYENLVQGFDSKFGGMKATTSELILSPQGDRFKMTQQADGSFKMEVTAGANFKDGAAAAIEQATARSAEVGFDFNGVTMKAREGSTVDGMTKEYLAEQQRRAEEYRNSPEGKAAAERRVREAAEKQTKVDEMIKSLPEVLKADDANKPNGKVLNWLEKFGDANDDYRVKLTAEQAKDLARQFEEAGWKAHARVGDPAAKTDLTAFRQWGVGQAVAQLQDGEKISSNMTSLIADGHNKLLREDASRDAVIAAGRETAYLGKGESSAKPESDSANISNRTDVYAPLDPGKPGFQVANETTWRSLVEKSAAGNGLTGFGADMDNAMLRHVADANALLEKAADAAKNGGPKLSWQSMEKALTDTDRLGDSGASHSFARALVIATAREDVGRAYYEALRSKSSDRELKKQSYEDYVKSFNRAHGGADASGLSSIAKADIAKTVKEIGKTIGNDTASKELFLAALNNDQTALNSFVKLNDAARTDQERQALQNLRDKVKGMSPEEMKVFKEHLLSGGAHGDVTMETLGKVGLATGLLAAISSAVYYAQQHRQQKPVLNHKVPVFSVD